VFGGVQFETARTPRSRFLAKLKEKGIDAKEYAKEKGLDKSTTDERYEELIKELG
jgi:flavodoxin